MSANPFRIGSQQPTAAAPSTSSSNTDSRALEARNHGRDTIPVHSASSTSPVKTKKSVRIESPTETIPPHPVFQDVESSLSPSSPPYPVKYGHGLSSPPLGFPTELSDRAEDIEIENAAGRGDVEARSMTAAARKNYGSPQTVQSSSGAPGNPFARTLANIEPQAKGGQELAGQSRDRTAAENTPAGAPTKPSLDVESFKKLLMTGIVQSAPAPNPINTSAFESSSGTDTSSVSRQSIFEPVQDLHPQSESQRTSPEMVASDDERASLMGEHNNKKEKRIPPPAPKSRHGKSVSSRAPQTVSFEHFSANEATPSPPPNVGRSDSDLNKPLPLTPPVSSSQAPIFSHDNTYALPSRPGSRGNDTAALSDAASAQKKVPPPVPFTRRHSQLRNSVVGNRSRSNSSLTMSSQHSEDSPVLSPGLKEEPTSSPFQKTPPPPPPSRHRGAALASISTSSTNSSSAAVRRSNITSPSAPSSRRPTLSSELPPTGGLARTSSLNSTRNSIRTISNDSTASALPPPPPPPRRRPSGRVSQERSMASSPTENRRTSVEHKRRTSAASVSSLKYEYAPASGADNGEHVLSSPKEEESEAMSGSSEKAEQVTKTASILDDMDKFQKEIEDLRAKYHHAA